MLPSRIFFDDLLGRMDENANKMQCDIYEKDGVFYIEMDIPGFSKDDISIQMNKGTITISAEKKEEVEDNKKYLRQERKFYGKYERSFYLGDVDEENISASFNDGILNISIPKRIEENTKRTIEIK